MFAKQYLNNYLCWRRRRTVCRKGRVFINSPGEGARWVPAEFPVIKEPLWQVEESNPPFKNIMPAGIIYPKILRQLFKYLYLLIACPW